jgi:hypothetical protein
LRLPVVESPGALGGLVGEPAAKVLPPGYNLAAGFPSPFYPRPKGATPLRASLVVASEACSEPDEVHGPPLAFPSCTPPVEESGHLTVGTPDANGEAANSIGFARYAVLRGNPATPADDSDVRVQASITDVRDRGDLSDYTGDLELRHIFRWTDRFNAVGPGGGNQTATMVDVPFPVIMPCAVTADPGVGSTCSVETTIDAVVPGAVREGKRMIWAMGQVEVYDGGADGSVVTAPNTVFARQGVFVP